MKFLFRKPPPLIRIQRLLRSTKGANIAWNPVEVDSIFALDDIRKSIIISPLHKGYNGGRLEPRRFFAVARIFNDV